MQYIYIFVNIFLQILNISQFNWLVNWLFHISSIYGKKNIILNYYDI